MAWTTADLATIDAAIATGVKEVRYADRTVVYNSIADLVKARGMISNALALAAGTQPTRMVRAYTSSGWGGSSKSGPDYSS